MSKFMNFNAYIMLAKYLKAAIYNLRRVERGRQRRWSLDCFVRRARRQTVRNLLTIRCQNKVRLLVEDSLEVYKPFKQAAKTNEQNTRLK